MKNLLLNATMSMIMITPGLSYERFIADNNDDVSNNLNNEVTYDTTIMENDTTELFFVDYPNIEEVYEPIIKYYTTTVALNQRQTPDLQFEPIGWLNAHQPVKGIDTLANGWVELEDGSFVNGKYLAEKDMTEAEFVQAKEAYQLQMKKAAEERRQILIKKQAEQKQAQVKQQQAQKANISASRSGTSLSDYEFDLLARLVRAEAGGESYEGMVAVASVVLNRVRHSSFPNSIEGVVYARNQFSPVANGSIKKPASDVHFKAVRDAMARDNTNGATFFYAPKLVKSKYMESLKTVAVIGSHEFKVNR